ncbi:ribosome biogenesis GTPase Der [Peptoniphilus sp. KCTC 25270]|uniref:ribosome biogenesis GTPase Der n=1 Tax=Peptoniphilus sp. KCTC 25270 TaxID=2897414 RepID=UPI001E60C386|nr:ribosome biogenesis GTPase Der [Peptoniphilus sp. KCTC 25270]MCD1146961.1 ribosome biogenesis GTPase Der [Peptoniphilus sp. KCTC 25270]
MDRPVICILGRPNVGKSTLFNTITGSKISITEDTPGVTRDRIYAKGNWLGREFTVIDTGGLDPNSEEPFMPHIVSQAEVAIENATVILFVVDGKDGISSIDEEIAEILRRSKKPTILTVNKMDSKQTSENLYDFYSLGLGEPIVISAEQGRGIGDLLDACIEGFGPEEEETYSDEIKVAFIGKPNAGKSSLVNHILGEKRSIVTNIPGTTRDSIHSFFEYEDTEYVLIDTAGLRKRKKINENIERYSVVRTLRSIEIADVCVLLVDAEEGISEQDSKIAGYAHDNNKAMIIAVNKWDLIEKDNHTMKNFENSIRRELPFLSYAPMIFISALTGQRVDKLLKMIHVVNNNYSMRIQTGVLNDILNRAVLMNQPPSDKGKRGKLYYGSQVSTRPPKIALSVNDKELFHFTYVRYLENQIRAAYRFDGVPIIMELRNR